MVQINALESGEETYSACFSKRKQNTVSADGATPGKAPGRNLHCDSKAHSLSGFTCSQLAWRRNRVFPGKSALVKRGKQNALVGISVKCWLLIHLRKGFLYV